MSSAALLVAGIEVSPDHYIDGRRVASAQRFELFSPIDQRLLGEVAEGLPVYVEQALAAAGRAFPAWAALSAAERKPFLDRFADEIGRRAEALCLLESNDAGVLLSRMRHGVVPCFEVHVNMWSEHFGRVLYHFQTVFSCDRENGGHIHWQTINVDNQDRFRFRRDFRLDLGHVHIPSLRLAVDHYWGGTSPHDGRCAGNDRESWQDHLITHTDTERFHRHF
jgi:hypothetical protein